MLLDTCQRLLDDRVSRSTAARARLRDLEGRRLGVAVAGTGLALVLAARGGRIELTAGESGAASPGCDAALSAGPLTLLALARSSTLRELKSSAATLSGHLHVAEGFADVLRLLAPDLEAELAGWIGDIPAHELARLLRAGTGWTVRAGHAFEQNAAEYLQEENPLLAPPSAVRRFADHVDRLRDDVERAAERVDALAPARTAPGKT